MRIELFPFKHIVRDSRVVLYGAGLVGQTYLAQIQLTKYCDVVCIIDKSFQRYEALPVEVCPVESLLQKDYDYIVIANRIPIVAQEITDMLVEQYGVSKEKIVYSIEYVEPVVVLRDVSAMIPDCELAFSRKGKFAVAVRMVGGLGDFIIRKNNLRELAQWDENLIIDVYVDQSKFSFTKGLLVDIPQIYNIVGTISAYDMKKTKYLASFYFDTLLRVDYIHMKAIEEVPQSLKAKILEVNKNYLAYGIYNGGRSYGLHYARCEKDSLNCYTSYNRYGGFQVEDYHTTIPMREDKKAEFLGLELGDYITLNYGWDNTSGNKKPSAKAWPLEYFSKLTHMIREMYSAIKIVQIGLADTPQIEGCDCYLFGKDIEVIKYVLKNSLLHVDCEGGMVHLASQFDTKCIVMFGPTPVKYYGYASNANIVSTVCSNCYWLVNDSISCYRKLEKPECMYSILPEQVFEKVRECLG